MIKYWRRPRYYNYCGICDAESIYNIFASRLINAFQNTIFFFDKFERRLNEHIGRSHFTYTFIFKVKQMVPTYFITCLKWFIWISSNFEKSKVRWTCIILHITMEYAVIFHIQSPHLCTDRPTTDLSMFAHNFVKILLAKYMKQSAICNIILFFCIFTIVSQRSAGILKCRFKTNHPTLPDRQDCGIANCGMSWYRMEWEGMRWDRGRLRSTCLYNNFSLQQILKQVVD